MGKKIVRIIGATSTLFIPAAGTLAQQPAEKPNVIFILADDIGYGDLSCYGEKTISTPNVEALAAKGVRFTDAHATAATSTPSRYSLLTGQYAWRRNDTGIAPGDAGMIIRPEQTTLPGIFKNAGYTTAAIGKWHLGLGDKTGTQNWNGLITPGLKDIEFDYSYIMAATGDRVPCVFVENQRVVNLEPNDPIQVSYATPFPGEPLGKDHPELLTKLKPSHGHNQTIVNGIARIGYMKGGKSALWTDEYIADSITSKAVKFIEENKNHPFFLYFATNDVHVPRVPNPRFVGKSGMGARGDAILEFDWSVGEVLKTLDKFGLTENTIIVLTSDNGPVVDDGYQDRAVELLGSHRPWGPFRGGKYSNFEAGTRVPLIVKWPVKVKPRVSDALVSQVDLFASFSELLNEKLENGVAPDSHSYLSTFLGKSKKGRDYVVEQAGALSITTGDWKYIAPSNGPAYGKETNTEYGNSKEIQLYRIKEDRGEKNNIAPKHREKVAELNAYLESEKAKK